MRIAKAEAAGGRGVMALGGALTALGVALFVFALVCSISGLNPGGAVNGWMCLVMFLFLIPGAAILYRKRYYRMEFQKKVGLWGVIFLLPWLVGFVLFFLVPMARAFVFSFQDIEINPAGGLIVENVGWDNFRYIAKEHATFTRDLTETVLKTLLYTALIIVFSLLCAILLNGKFFGRGAARAIFFVPIVMATGLMVERVTDVSSMLMAQAQSDKVYGAAIISEMLYSLGVGRNIVSYLLGAVNDIFEVVSLSGIQILIFLAALQGIPPQLYEVAKIEGATGYETFWKVTVVMVSPMILTCTLYTISDLFLRSDLAETFQEVAFTQGQYGLSAAMSVLFLIAVLLSIALYILPLRKVVFYYD